jgi:hypothetical protein
MNRQDKNFFTWCLLLIIWAIFSATGHSVLALLFGIGQLLMVFYSVTTESYGRTIYLRPGETIAEAVNRAEMGDTIVLMHKD